MIATNVGGIPEEMKDGETGFLVEKGNHGELTSKLSILFNDDEKARQMGINGKRFVWKILVGIRLQKILLLWQKNI